MYQSVTDVINLQENSKAYQDTIQRLRLRVNQLQERLSLEEQKEGEVDDAINEEDVKENTGGFSNNT